MPRIEPFEKYIDQYEKWFVTNRYAYLSEIEAIRRHLPTYGRGLEIGVGSGLFAAPLGISHGVEPSGKMRVQAVSRGINVVAGVAEELPFEDNSYEYAAMITTICFVDDLKKSIQESHRVIKSRGKLIIGMVDKNSRIGKLYRKFKYKNIFYSCATFYATAEIVDLLQEVGFTGFYFTQTIFKKLDQINKPEEVREGFGSGSFVVISGKKKETTP
jgi:ubiquinone/menaquinone biosynthesis C-methylase UbiE